MSCRHRRKFDRDVRETGKGYYIFCCCTCGRFAITRIKPPKECFPPALLKRKK